jgi:hypothetical protein
MDWTLYMYFGTYLSQQEVGNYIIKFHLGILSVLTIWCHNSKVQHHVHKSPPLVPILSLVNPLHTLQLVFLRSILIPSLHLHLSLLRVIINLFSDALSLLYSFRVKDPSYTHKNSI